MWSVCQRRLAERIDVWLIQGCGILSETPKARSSRASTTISDSEDPATLLIFVTRFQLFLNDVIPLFRANVSLVLK